MTLNKRIIILLIILTGACAVIYVSSLTSPEIPIINGQKESKDIFINTAIPIIFGKRNERTSFIIESGYGTIYTPSSTAISAKIAIFKGNWELVGIASGIQYVQYLYVWE